MSACPWNRNPKECASCGKQDAQRRCQCTMENYCDEECQRRRWGEHRRQCTFAMAQKASVSTERNLHRQAAELHHQTGELFFMAGDFDSAIKHFKLCIKASGCIPGGNPYITTLAYSNLGNTYMTTGECRKALQSLKLSLEIGKSEFGQDHPYTVSALLGMANVYIKQGRDQDALDLANRCLDIEIANHGFGSLMTAKCLYNLGGILETRHCYDEAMVYFSQVAKIVLSIPHGGAEQQLLAKAHAASAGIFAKQGFLDKAMEYYEKALRIARKAHGDKHPTVVITLNFLAQILSQKGMHADAVKTAAKSLRLARKVYGGANFHTAAPMVTMAQVLANQKNYPEAIKLYGEGLEIIARAPPGFRHLVPLWNYQLAGTCYLAGDPCAAREALRRAYDSVEHLQASDAGLRDCILEGMEDLAREARNG